MTVINAENGQEGIDKAKEHHSQRVENDYSKILNVLYSIRWNFLSILDLINSVLKAHKKILLLFKFLINHFYFPFCSKKVKNIKRINS
ncbi:MAG: hypothetical protein ACI93N_000723 [Flavobacteriaceae bacterium]|jgi:hypothetical protein